MSKKTKLGFVIGFVFPIIFTATLVVGASSLTAVTQNCFTDVSTSDWFHDFVCWLFDNDITAGYPDGTYRPNNPITRAEAAVFIQRGYELAEANDNDTLGGLSCENGQTAKWDGSNWTCNEDEDTLGSLSCGSGQVPVWNGSTWGCGSISRIKVSPLGVITSDDSQVTLRPLQSGKLEIRPEAAGIANIYFPVDTPSQIFGVPQRLDRVRICYQTDTIIDYIDEAHVGFLDSSGNYTELLSLLTPHATLTWGCYFLVDSSPNIVDGSLFLRFRLNFSNPGDAHDIRFGVFTLHLIED